MTPSGLDADVVGRRLRLLRQALEDLTPLREVTADRLNAEPLTRAAAERLAQVVVDLAVDVNAHLVVARLGRAPATSRASFADVAEAGVISRELAERLAPAAGLRNVLVHRYADISAALVTEALPTLLDGFDEYVRAVARFIQTTG